MQSHLHIILRHARQKNKLRNVTGLLVFVDNTFLQVLEGEETDVKNVFDKHYYVGGVAAAVAVGTERTAMMTVAYRY